MHSVMCALNSTLGFDIFDATKSTLTQSQSQDLLQIEGKGSGNMLRAGMHLLVQ